MVLGIKSLSLMSPVMVALFSCEKVISFYVTKLEVDVGLAFTTRNTTEEMNKDIENFDTKFVDKDRFSLLKAHNLSLMSNVLH